MGRAACQGAAEQEGAGDHVVAKQDVEDKLDNCNQKICQDQQMQQQQQKRVVEY
jgi:hypothetical protein